jgi:hypothetical protein
MRKLFFGVIYEEKFTPSQTLPLEGEGRVGVEDILKRVKLWRRKREKSGY